MKAPETPTVSTAPFSASKAAMTSSLNLTARQLKVLLLGQSKVGKTIAANLAAKNSPDKVPAEKLTKLVGVLNFQIESQATDSLLAQNLYTEQVIDMAPELARLSQANVPGPEAERAFKQLWRESCELAAREREAGTVQTISVDTLTTLDIFVLALAAKNVNEGPQRGTYAANMHQWLFSALLATGCDLIFLAHGKVPFMMEDKKDATKNAMMEARHTAQSVAGDGFIEPDIQGRARAFYERQCDCIVPLILTDSKERFIGTSPEDGFISAVRYPFLARREPAHMGKLFNKIRSNVAAKKESVK